MAIRMSQPFIHASPYVQREVQNAVLMRGGSKELARVVLGANEYARNVGDANAALRARVAQLERDLIASEDENHRLRAAFNPFRWSLKMSYAWHQNIPNVQAAFEALMDAALKEKS